MPPLALSELGHAIADIPVPRAHVACPPASIIDDDLLANMLISMWALASGRFLRRGVRPEQLTEEELINFWADDMTTPSGRHAAPSHPPKASHLPRPGTGRTLTEDQ